MFWNIVSSVLWWTQWILVLIIFIRLLLSHRPPEIVFAWGIVLFFLPYVGLLIYIIFGMDRTHRRIMKTLPEDQVIAREPEEIIKQTESLQLALEDAEELNDAQKAMKCLLNTSNAPVSVFNDVSFYFDGKSYFDDLIHDIDKATHSIYMQYYIWRSDELGVRVLDALCKKAAEGVEICLIFDGVGCLFKISHRYKKRMKKAGIRFRYFMNPSLLTLPFVNYRNHRKLVIIDDAIGYVGGFNIGNEYIDGGDRYETWRDTGAKVIGQIIPYLKDIFEVSWRHSQGGPLIQELEPPKPGVTTIMQVASSGPDSQWYSIEKLYMTLITNANQSVLIQSPYLILNSAFLNVLQVAALSGIDVQLMVTGVPDKKIPYWVAETFFEPLIRAGVKIYRYSKGFLHAKMLIVDDYVATLGSCNCDIRSFRLAYENNIVVYDQKKVAILKEQFAEDLQYCWVVDKARIKKYSFFKRLRDSIFRLFAPIL